MPEISRQELAAQYGFALSVLNSNSELSRLFNRAVRETWTPDRFIAQVRGTTWYKKNSESERAAQIQKAADPASYQQGLQQVKARVRLLATEYGAVVNSNILNRISSMAYTQNLDDNQLRRQLANYVKFTDGRLIGQAGQAEREFRSYADAMGIGVSNAWIKTRASRVVRGSTTVEDALSELTQKASSRYPQFKDRFKAGETLEDIAAPYKQSVADILEINPEAIKIRDKIIQKGLSAPTESGKPPREMALWEYEDTLRRDSRWKYTDNANAQMADVASTLGQFFGKSVG